MTTTPKLHPAIDNGVQPTDPNFAGGVLTCLCKTHRLRCALKRKLRTITCVGALNVGSRQARHSLSLQWRRTRA